MIHDGTMDPALSSATPKSSEFGRTRDIIIAIVLGSARVSPVAALGNMIP